MILEMLAAHLITKAPCAELYGSRALFSDKATQVIWVGELHGTNEQPALFKDIICSASSERKSVTVALERSAAEQPEWDTFMNSDGGPDSVKRLLKSPSWNSPIQDGRSSRAMLELAEWLRTAKHAGQISSVKLIRASASSTGSTRFADTEKEMAANVWALVDQKPNSIVLVYTGDLHAQKRDTEMSGVAYAFAAKDLPPQSVKTVLIFGEDGKAWNCQSDGCNAHEFSGSQRHERQVVEDHRKPERDFLAFTGVATTASPPAVSTN